MKWWFVSVTMASWWWGAGTGHVRWMLAGLADNQSAERSTAVHLVTSNIFSLKTFSSQFQVMDSYLTAGLMDQRLRCMLLLHSNVMMEWSLKELQIGETWSMPAKYYLVFWILNTRCESDWFLRQSWAGCSGNNNKAPYFSAVNASHLWDQIHIFQHKRNTNPSLSIADNKPWCCKPDF